MSANQEVSYRRRVVATMHRNLGRGDTEIVMVRHYAYFDTAVPRMVQLALNYAVEGDFVEFYSHELGFQIGILRVRKNGVDLEMSPLVKSSPTLLKLINSDEGL